MTLFLGQISTPALHTDVRTVTTDRTMLVVKLSGFSAADGPGWFESSRDLEQGLTVLEGLSADLALKDWLEECRARR